MADNNQEVRNVLSKIFSDPNSISIQCNKYEYDDNDKDTITYDQNMNTYVLRIGSRFCSSVVNPVKKTVFDTYINLTLDKDKSTDNEHWFNGIFLTSNIHRGDINPSSCKLLIKNVNNNIYALYFYDDYEYNNRSYISTIYDYIKSFIKNPEGKYKYIHGSTFNGI